MADCDTGRETTIIREAPHLDLHCPAENCTTSHKHMQRMQAHCKSAHKVQKTETIPLDGVVRSIIPDSEEKPNAKNSVFYESSVDNSIRSLSPSPEIEEVPWQAAENQPGQLIMS